MTAQLGSTVLLLITEFCFVFGELERPSNEAAAKDLDTIYVVLFILVLCFAMRHANDFYSGETVTLVEEGATSGRFRHRVETRMLSSIERDFNNMYEQLKDKEDMRLQEQANGPHSAYSHSINDSVERV